MNYPFRILFFLISQLPIALCGQNSRLNTYNSIGWYNPFLTVKLTDKVSIHSEYQFRRTEYITNWQQSLVRVGLNYQLNPRLLIRFGYANAETYAYGSLPINVYGKNFNENRFFEMFQISSKEGPVEFVHRFILEQRFTGKYSSASQTKEDQTVYTNRARYMIRLVIPIRGTEVKDKTIYTAVYDEVLISFGKNVAANVFDQNRIGALLGYRFSKAFRLEGGYINQTLQFGRLIDGRNVFQSNSGIILNAFITIDLTPHH